MRESRRRQKPIFESTCVLYWPNGQMKRRVEFVNGLRHGKDEIWNEEGLLVDTAEFKEGKPVGVHRRFSDDGKLIEEVEYFPDGTFRLC